MLIPFIIAHEISTLLNSRICPTRGAWQGVESYLPSHVKDSRLKLVRIYLLCYSKLACSLNSHVTKMNKSAYILQMWWITLKFPAVSHVVLMHIYACASASKMDSFKGLLLPRWQQGLSPLDNCQPRNQCQHAETDSEQIHQCRSEFKRERKVRTQKTFQLWEDDKCCWVR